MPTITSGNLDQNVTDHPETGGWVIGHFMDTDPFFQTDDFEVKWAIHPKGEIKPGVLAKTTAKTIVVLFTGKFVTRFPDIGKEVVLSKPGDYVVYDAHEVLHDAEALEDTKVFVIRWPSKR